MNQRLLTPLLIGLVALSTSLPRARPLCEGYFPEHDKKIPVLGPLADEGLSRAEFDAVLDRIEEVYTPLIAARGGRLEVRRLWDNGSINASAQRSGSRYIINMFGGMARHKAMTVDAFATVACHEIGHHIGGAPKAGGFGRSWASVEGQSDYYANLKCHDLIFSAAGTERFLESGAVVPIVKKRCGQVFASAKARAHCMRSAMAAQPLGEVSRDLRGGGDLPQYDTPDPKVVAKTSGRHPASQCRMDTHFQSALCAKPASEPLSAKDPAAGTCTRAEGLSLGVRPLCWYAPPTRTQAPLASIPIDREGGQIIDGLGDAEGLWKGI